MTARASVVQEARTWLGTPYHHLADIKGVGVDCAMLLVRVYTALGLVPATLDPRPYAPDWHLNQGEEKYLGWVNQFASSVVVPQAGDVALWRFGRTYSHGAIVLDDAGTIVHAYREAGNVVLGNLHETALITRPHVFYKINGLQD
jgi:cell wall-associated NlpC family hydrolase